MHISDFDYQLPEELIAQHPLTQRDATRMLVVDRTARSWSDSSFASLTIYLNANDVLVINNSRVFPARLKGARMPTGGAIELLLLREIEPKVWEALAKPARRLRKGTRIVFGESKLQAEVIELLDDGRRVIRFETEEDFDRIIDELGEPPLPPYIKRETRASGEDRERYQTVYATVRGAIAAPTAGLHFTPQILSEIEARGVRIVEVTLHVGYGTFEPVRKDDVSQHRVAPERFSITEEAAETINQRRAAGGRVVAVGTTTTRALEASVTSDGQISVRSEQDVALTIIPGHAFRAVDALLTNFHLPRSSLLMLVSAFAGRELILAAYSHAASQGYRFYSYGDCMLIV